MIRMVSKNAIALALVAVICVVILGSLHLLTQPKIAEQRRLSQLAILSEVLPEVQQTRALLANCTLVNAPDELGGKAQRVYRWQEDDQLRAYVLDVTAPDGYSGNIELIVAISPTGTVLGTRVLNHQETPGLGDKIETRRSNWIYSFSGKAATPAEAKHWAVKKDGGDFDQFTGATITPRAVINAVYRAASYVQQHPELARAATNCELTP
ncbi:electron transport complex subunit RsxG [Rheinheimera sp. UJ51]|uniref:electron transport complex subunit RsxG n=1 Tax=unclassified Rheinheimera TaxID=115860 RepID=UPI001E29726B|nr:MULTISPECIES: electron transport complex subunit RsxG [unclassified Rheinheimera]MCC5450154.1 electron transport complex subunit RsxG [Rheinheimera sp. UJ51]MCF4009395.1 electron transport complex subunit RsxG [Rheinheimera sp. UJ63]